MAKQKPSETGTQVPPPPAAEEPKTRKRIPIQPEIALEIETCKKRMASLKALNKLTPVLQGMDKDALLALKKIIENTVGE